MPRQDEVEVTSDDEEPSHTTFPSKLIGRVLHEQFTSPITRISPDALALVAEYLRIYTREAIWRASQGRRKTDTVAGALGAGVLEVDDLERIAGPLTLDFS
jgi:CENP-S associating Centromere protein X